MLSHIVSTSSSRWDMKIIATPEDAMRFRAARSWSASLSVRRAVGSSKTSTRTPILSTSLATSMNCMKPMGSPRTGSISSMPSPMVSSA